MKKTFKAVITEFCQYGGNSIIVRKDAYSLNQAKLLISKEFNKNYGRNSYEYVEMKIEEE